MQTTNDYFREIGIVQYYINLENKTQEKYYINMFENTYNLIKYKNNNSPILFINTESFEKINKNTFEISKKIYLYSDNVIDIDKYKNNILLLFTMSKKVKENACLTNIKCEIINNFIYQYPCLFHKYTLNISKPNDPMIYEIIKENTNIEFLNNKLCAHLHCFDIDKFDEYYGEYINDIIKYYSVIVTFSIGKNIPLFDFTVIKMQNKGMDIGAKFIAVNYLNKIGFNYDFILMLHSKSNKQKREEYFQPFLKNMKKVIENLNMEYGIYTIDQLYCGENPMQNRQQCIHGQWGSNSMYMEEVIKYLNLPNFKSVFPEGNVYILSNKIANYIYDDNLKLYNCLNSEKSFDYSWVKKYYNIQKNDINYLYNEYINKKLHGNNMSTCFGWNGLADSMIEHIFERIVFGVCLKFKKKICILSQYDEIYDDFDVDSFSTFDLFPKTIIACHTNSEIKYKTILNNIKYLKNISSRIIIINSDEYMGQIELLLNNEIYIINDELSDKQANIYLNNNKDLKKENYKINDAKIHWKKYGKYENRLIPGYFHIEIQYQKNTSYLCHGKWYNYLKNITDNKSSYILTNDSFIITRELDDFKTFFKSKYEMVGILDSYEQKYHYPDFLRYYNNSGIAKLMIFFDEKMKNYNSYDDAVRNEIESTYITNNRECLYKMDFNYKKNIHFDDNMNKKYLEQQNYPIIKLKRLYYITYDKFPFDFDPKNYKELNSDLQHFSSDIELTNHFINHGMNEGRQYKKNQKMNVSNYLKKYTEFLMI
jgi:hypothetical protein